MNETTDLLSAKTLDECITWSKEFGHIDDPDNPPFDHKELIAINFLLFMMFEKEFDADSMIGKFVLWINKKDKMNNENIN